jgi:hypothetical protein
MFGELQKKMTRFLEIAKERDECGGGVFFKIK